MLGCRQHQEGTGPVFELSTLPRGRVEDHTRRLPSACFVHTPCLALRDDRLEPPLGLLYLTTVALARGHHAVLCDLASADRPDPDREVPDGYDVYGFSTYTANYAETRAIARAVGRRNPAALLVAGGPHASALPQAVLEDGFDTVVTGEGEVTMLGILAGFADGGPARGVVPGIPADPLDGLPYPDYTAVELDSYSREVDGEKCLSILSSRGCPYKCTFCNSNIMGAGRPIRYRSPANVVGEIREIRRRWGIRHLRFQDDIFTINRRRVAEITTALAAEDIVYRCFARVNTCADSPEVPRLLRESGCAHVSVGVETGSPELLASHAMHKSQTPGQIRDALRNIHDAGIRSRIFLMVGFPGETDDTVAETIALMKSCPWDEFSVYPLIAYPGTPLHDHPERFGITHVDRSYADYLQIGRDFRAGFTLRTDTFDEDDVHRWRDHVIEELVADGRTWAGDSRGFK